MSEVARPVWRYALVMRPAGLGAVPADLRYTVEARPDPGHPHHAIARHGILVAQRELADDEVDGYELGVLIDDHAALAQRVAGALSDYGEEMVDLLETDQEMARGIITTSFRQSVPSRYFSLADEDGMVEAVIASLGRSEAAQSRNVAQE